MHEIDHLSRFRDTVPLGATPRAEELFRAALREEQYSVRPVVLRPHNPLVRIRSPWRLGASVSVAAALVAGIVVAVLPSSPVVLTVRLLADRASSAALAQPTVSPGQWVYRMVEWNRHSPRGVPLIGTEAGWETADGQATYGNNYSEGGGPGSGFPGYSQLGSLPRAPAALDAYLAHLMYPHSNPAPDIKGLCAFLSIEDMLSEYVLPPALAAEFYQALAIIPAIKVDSHVTAIDGQAGVAFVLPPTRQSERLEIILDASNYRFLAQASSGSDGSFLETAVARMVIVGAPGSTRPSLAPPTAAELLAERADQAVSWVSGPQLFAESGTWILRELATSSGDHTVWATGDDSEQASYVSGKLQVCSRSAACAKSTQWLMPAGPPYALVNPPVPQGRPSFRHLPPTLPDSLPQLLAKLNTYHTGCTDVAGGCNAVNAMADMLAGYGSRGGPPGDWFLMLADIPGVTVQRLTDVTGQADVAFSFPFTNGVTKILLNARTHKLVGYVRDGIQTVITKEVAVSGPGSRTPEVIHPRFSRLPLHRSTREHFGNPVIRKRSAGPVK